MPKLSNAVLEAYRFHRGRGIKPQYALALAKARVKAQELGLGAVWVWDDGGYYNERDANDNAVEYYCCNVWRRLEAGYTDGRDYERWVFRARYGRYPKPHEQSGTERYTRYNEGHNHEYYGCVIALEDDIDRDAGDLRKAMTAYASLWGIELEKGVSAWSKDPYCYEVEDELYLEAIAEREREIREAIADWAHDVEALPITG